MRWILRFCSCYGCRFERRECVAEEVEGMGVVASISVSQLFHTLIGRGKEVAENQLRTEVSGSFTFVVQSWVSLAESMWYSSYERGASSY